jgi:lysozyme family protein
MDNFEFAHAFMAPHEWNARKNYTNDPDDPGGPTKFGITLNSWRGLGSHADLNEDGVIDAKDIMLIGDVEEKFFYRNHYWVFGKLESDQLAAKLFDIGVNLGPETATRYLQVALTACGSPVVADGSIGPKTEAAANAVSKTNLLGLLTDISNQQRSHYELWISKNPRREKFRAGLLARAAALPPNTQEV